ncbi:hypothetical protein [Desulfocastanea catecholica]
MSAYSEHDSKSFEEGQEFVAWLEPEVSTAWRLQSLKGFFLHCQIGGYVDVRRLDILVAEPHRDSGDVHAGLQQVHGGGVAKMESSPFSPLW